MRNMRSHGWGGNTPASDQEAIERILDAADQIISERGTSMRIADVARTLGVTRQTVYRYFPGTEALRVATTMRSANGFLNQIEAELKGITDPVVAIVEGFAFAMESFALNNQVESVLNQVQRGGWPVPITSDTALTFGRAMLRKFDVDWDAAGFDDSALEELTEFTLRVLHSFLADSGRPPRKGAELRRYLTRWLGPAITYPQLERAMSPLGDTESRSRRRRTSA
jgi:AcrR family transcriptional regulator